jgi:hypothetical protein
MDPTTAVGVTHRLEPISASEKPFSHAPPSGGPLKSQPVKG